MKIVVKRVYEDLDNKSYRVLADRLWPRGIKKEDLKADIWPKEICPSNELRKSFHSEKIDQDEFKEEYRKEIKENKDNCENFKKSISDKENILLLSAAKNPVHCYLIKEELEKE